MSYAIADGLKLAHDSLAVIPLGGQSELGQMLWVICCAGEILLIDAGASYPSQDLPGVDLLLPNTNFLEANKDKIAALLLTNGHEEHCGAASYLLRHIPVPRIMGSGFVCAFLNQSKQITKYQENNSAFEIDRVQLRHNYQIGPFTVEWIQVNDAIADACALKIGTPQGNIVYTSSFKLDQTPVDKRLLDIGRLAQIGDQGVLLLISASAGVENSGYTTSEKIVEATLSEKIQQISGRVIVAMSGTNTCRLQALFDIAKRLNRKVYLSGVTLINAAVAAAITGNLLYEPTNEANSLEKIADEELLIVATGQDGDPINLLTELAEGIHDEIILKPGDTIIFSAEIPPGRARKMAAILDQLLSQKIKIITGEEKNIHVPKHASREELKLMLSLIKPKYFVPTYGEGRHIMHHAQLAIEWGLASDAVFPLKNGEILAVDYGVAGVIGAVESQAVFLNRDQGERVTAFSLSERKALSAEGVLTISLAIDGSGKLVNEPAIAASASAFLNSQQWQETKPELIDVIANHLNKQIIEQPKIDLNQLKASLREAVIKVIRSKLQAKPSVQVVIHQITTKPLQ